MEEVKKKKSALYYVALIGLPLIVLGVGFIAYNFYADNNAEKQAEYEEKLFAVHDIMKDDASTFSNISEIYSNLYNSDNSSNIEKVEDKLNEEGIIEELDFNQEYVKRKMKDLRKPPKKYKAMYKKMVELESAYNDMHKNYLLPESGSYNDFVQSKAVVSIELAKKNAETLQERLEIIKDK